MFPGSTYQSAPGCLPCGDTPLFEKWAAKRMAEGYHLFPGFGIFKCPYYKGWHVIVTQTDAELRLLPTYRRSE